MAAPGRAKAGPAANEGETLAFRAPPPPVLYRPPREVVEHAVEAARAEVVRLSCGTFPHLAAKRKCHSLAFRAPPPAGLLMPIFGYGEAADQGDPDSWYAFVLPVDHLDPVALAADRNGGAQAHAREGSRPRTTAGPPRDAPGRSICYRVCARPPRGRRPRRLQPPSGTRR